MSQSPPDHPDYASPATDDVPHKRSLRMWLILLLAWTIGLAVWVVYIAAFTYLLIRFLL